MTPPPHLTRWTGCIHACSVGMESKDYKQTETENCFARMHKGTASTTRTGSARQQGEVTALGSTIKEIKEDRDCCQTRLFQVLALAVVDLGERDRFACTCAAGGAATMM